MNYPRAPGRPYCQSDYHLSMTLPPVNPMPSEADDLLSSGGFQPEYPSGPPDFRPHDATPPTVPPPDPVLAPVTGQPAGVVPPAQPPYPAPPPPVTPTPPIPPLPPAATPAYATYPTQAPPVHLTPIPPTYGQPKRPNAPLFIILIVVAAVVLATAGYLIGHSRGQPLPTDTTTLPVQPTLPASTFGSPPVLRHVLDDPPVVEAIGLTTQPADGPSWLATDAIPADQGLISETYVTPCGVFVTALEPNWADDMPNQVSPAAGSSRLLGYDIATGRLLWTIATARTTGLNDPRLTGDLPTYTPNCHMTLNFLDQVPPLSGIFLTTLVIDLTTGSAFPAASTGGGECSAVDDTWVTCWRFDRAGSGSSVDLVNLATEAITPADWPAMDAMTYAGMADVSVAGAVWSDAGYRDPVSGQVLFGADVHAGKGQPDDPWVMYVDPRRPGGYRSGLVLRVEGTLDVPGSTCKITLWDATTDQAAWPAAQLIPCGGAQTYTWATAGQTLIVQTPQPGANLDGQVLVFALSDGTPLWQMPGRLDWTDWDTHSPQFGVTGLSESYAWIASDDTGGVAVVRLADGATMGFPPYGLATSADTLAFSFGAAFDADRAFTISGLSIDPAQPARSPLPAWTTTIALDFPYAWRTWTFATGGVMYVVSQADDGQIQVTQLV